MQRATPQITQANIPIQKAGLQDEKKKQKMRIVMKELLEARKVR